MDWSVSSIMDSGTTAALCAVSFMIDMTLEEVEGYSLLGSGSEIPTIYMAKMSGITGLLYITCIMFYEDITWMIVLNVSDGQITTSSLDSVSFPAIVMETLVTAEQITEYKEIKESDILKTLELVYDFLK